MAMLITLEYLTEAFDKYNRLIFGGVLPQPRIKLSKARTKLGSFSYKQKNSFLKKIKYDYTITISVYYHLQEHEVDDILIHEMIHYYIAYQNMRDTSSHGKVFRNMMKEINSKYGRNMNISVKSCFLSQRDPQKQRQCVVLVLHLDDGKIFVTSVNPSSIPTLNAQIKRHKKIHSASWFVSNDAFFQEMPRVRSLRGRKVGYEEYERIKKLLSPLS